jgi:Tfp pilus assembly protein PilF
VLSAARAALKVDSTLAEAHASLASYEVSYGWNWENARQHATRAVALKPGSSFAHMILGWYYVIVGQDASAVAEAQLAASLEPFSDEIGGNVVSMLRALGRQDLATAQIRRMMAAGIGSPTQLRAWLTWEYLLQNRMSDARIQLDSAMGISPECCKRTRALLYAHTGAHSALP